VRVRTFFRTSKTHTLNHSSIKTTFCILPVCRWHSDNLYSRHTDIINTQDDFNTLHPNVKFTAEPESNNQINFLDIIIHKKTAKWTLSIYRKPSFTDSIIPYSSNHPPQHKHAVIRYLHNRLNTYHLQHEEYKEELDTIHDIMQNNGFPTHTHTHTDPPPRDSPLQQPPARNQAT